jgi:hypothetical protein
MKTIADETIDKLAALPDKTLFFDGKPRLVILGMLKRFGDKASALTDDGDFFAAVESLTTGLAERVPEWSTASSEGGRVLTPDARKLAAMSIAESKTLTVERWEILADTLIGMNELRRASKQARGLAVR